VRAKRIVAFIGLAPVAKRHHRDWGFVLSCADRRLGAQRLNRHAYHGFAYSCNIGNMVGRRDQDRRRAQVRAAMERLRRRRGMKPHTESISRRKPWTQLGMSRASWCKAGKPGWPELKPGDAVAHADDQV